MIKVLHNSQCSKSIAVLEHLDEMNVAFEIIDILQNPLSELEVRTMLKKLGKKAIEVVRTKETYYQENLEGKDLSEEELIKILSQHPELIQRPILIKGGVAMIGRPIENVRFFIEK